MTKKTNTILRKGYLFKQLSSIFGARKAKVLILDTLDGSTLPYHIPEVDVGCFVSWHGTKQGWSYWNNLHTRLVVRTKRGLRGLNTPIDLGS